jgi:hypothetical protein
MPEIDRAIVLPPGIRNWQAAYEGDTTLSRGWFVTEIRLERIRRLAPDDAFLIEEVVDHFDAFTHLGLGLFGHRQDGSDNLARFHFIQ